MIIGISGKKQSGKDTVAGMIQYFTHQYEVHGQLFETYPEFLALGFEQEAFDWKRKQFAAKVKQIVCLLIGCTMEQLEDNSFKEKQLGEEWHCMYSRNKEHVLLHEDWSELGVYEQSFYTHRKMTPRMLLQLIGTDAGRKLIHPNIWVNATMADYTPYDKSYGQATRGDDGFFYYKGIQVPYEKVLLHHDAKEPNWIITDCRFPNEVKAIEDRGGVVLRLEKLFRKTTDNHESETALDNWEFKYTICNDGGKEALLEMVESFLKNLKIIK
jgi:hypothetical protein